MKKVFVCAVSLVLLLCSMKNPVKAQEQNIVPFAGAVTKYEQDSRNGYSCTYGTTLYSLHALSSTSTNSPNQISVRAYAYDTYDNVDNAYLTGYYDVEVATYSQNIPAEEFDTVSIIWKVQSYHSFEGVGHYIEVYN